MTNYNHAPKWCGQGGVGGSAEGGGGSSPLCSLPELARDFFVVRGESPASCRV